MAPDTTELAYSTATIIPGLINAHVHLASDPGPHRLARLTDNRAAAEIVLAMAGHARQLLDCGVTTASDLGDRGGLTVALRDGGEVAGPDQIRAQVRRNAAGADVIKVMASGGGMMPGGADIWEPQFTTDELKLVATRHTGSGCRSRRTLMGPAASEPRLMPVSTPSSTAAGCPDQGSSSPMNKIARDIVAAGIAVCTANSNDWRDGPSLRR